MSDRRRRNEIEIIYAILQGCKEGNKKTRLMYLAELNYPVFIKYIYKMEKMGLVRQEGEKYVITEKGKKVLELLDKYKEIYKRLSEIEKNLKDIIQI